MTIALVHYPMLEGETQVHTRRVRYVMTFLCGWDTEPGNTFSTERAAITCPGCRDTLLARGWRASDPPSLP